MHPLPERLRTIFTSYSAFKRAASSASNARLSKTFSPDSQAIRGFVGIDLSREAAPDATTLLKFRRLLLAQGLTDQIFGRINAHLRERGLMLREGPIVDATLIAAPSSTKNEIGERDPNINPFEKGSLHLIPLYAGPRV